MVGKERVVSSLPSFLLSYRAHFDHSRASCHRAAKEVPTQPKLPVGRAALTYLHSVGARTHTRTRAAAAAAETGIIRRVRPSELLRKESDFTAAYASPADPVAGANKQQFLVRARTRAVSGSLTAGIKDS